jgi:ABC-type nitrate/sulfonate/bicarbonate transport system substrate-binding protein
MALDLLKEQGYTVETVPLARFDLVPAALAKGDFEIGSFSPQGGWAAIAKGGEIETIVAQAGPTWSILTSDKLQKCEDLGKYPVGFSGTTGMQQAMLLRYARDHCPGTTPQILLAGDSDARLVSLLAGRIDAASLELEALLELERQAPGRFRRLIYASKDFPQIQIATFAVSRAWARANPESVKDFIRALLTTHRRIIQDPQALRDEIVKYLQVDSAQAQLLADAYLREDTWDPNGGLTPENIQLTLDFLKGIDALPAELQASDVANLTYLKAVLDEIGVK